MKKTRIAYVRKVLKKNGVKKTAWRCDSNYWNLRDTEKCFSNFTDKEIHLAVGSMK